MTDDAYADIDDPRAMELESIACIFPELDRTGPFSFTLQTDPKPEPPLRVRFRNSRIIRTLNYLPPVKLSVSLPDGYPDEAPPTTSIEADWLPKSVKAEVERQVSDVWNEQGPGEVVYSIIDVLQQLGEEAFKLGQNERNGIWHPLLDELHDILIPYNERRKKEEFDSGTFDCGICLEPKKGVSCYRMEHCGHVFCKACLLDMYNYAITTGEINSVHCPDLDCSKPKKLPVQPAEAAETNGTTDASKPKPTNASVKPTLHPSELTAIGLDPAQITRYESLKRKLYLDSDPTTALCPRSWCQGPTPEKPKPLVLVIDNTPPEILAELNRRRALALKNPPPDPSSKLAICSTCSYAFCLKCESSWHGAAKICRAKNHAPTLEELANERWIAENTSPCPNCEASVVKAYGCNHMTCKCGAHFCFLCGSFLNEAHVYRHWNTPGKECYQRLFEGAVEEEGGWGWGLRSCICIDDGDWEGDVHLGVGGFFVDILEDWEGLDCIPKLALFLYK
ncbi:RWD-domain-containing protein [Ascobolus immersus RN42]|uniref:RBR-type E3 ubiquitin transferase n=1 Tax=Ascobolus immersus RN42 TaxID=1160509 RepID=A0A3N4HWE7_ASCIM|nr:RWD-domain-containing protein [Ascobolus immersus RN42]